MSLPPFQSLVEEHGDGVQRFLVSLVGPHDAADCWQETMLSALGAYPSLRHGDNLRGWLFTIAHRKAVDCARGRTPGSHREPSEGVVAAPEPADDGLWEAVRRLPDKQRTAVACRYVLDLPYREIGAVVGCTESAARQNVRAGLRTLREEIG